jgi:uncharacterized protein
MHKPVALITGASTGIGFEMAKVFAALGYDLVVVARTEKHLKNLHKHMSPLIAVTDIAMDLSQPKAPQALFAKTQKLKLQVDVLVNNAGFGSSGNFVELDRHRELQQVDLNVRALTELCHLYGAEMAKRKTGKILNVASTAAFQPGPWMSVYYATKAYVLHFSEGLAEELKPRGVQVSVLCPGATVTEFADTAGVSDSKLFSSKLKKPATAEAVAIYGVNKFLKGKIVIVHGLLNRFLAFNIRFTPRALARKIAGYLNRQ